MHRAQLRVGGRVHLVHEAPVEGVLGRVGCDQALVAAHARLGVGEIAVEPGADPGEQGCPHRDRIRQLDHGDRLAGERRLDPHVDRVARQPADDPDLGRRRRLCERGHGERAAMRVGGHALEHRPEQAAAGDVGAEPEEGAAGISVGVRRRAQAQLRQEARTEAAGRRRRGLVDQRRVVGAARHRAPEPVHGGTRGRQAADHEPDRLVDHDHALRVAGAAQRRVARGRGEAHQLRLGGAGGAEQDARPHGIGRERADDVVVAADRDDAIARQAGRGGGIGANRAQPPAACQERRHQRDVDLHGAQHLVRPVERGDVEREGATGEAVIGRHLAAQPPGEVIGDVQPFGRARKSLGPVAAMPEQLAQAEDRVRRQAGDGEQAILADAPRDQGDLGPGALVEPGDRRPRLLSGGIQRYGRLGHARERDAGHALGPRDLVEGGADRKHAAAPQALAGVLGPFGLRIGDRRRLARDREHAAGGIDDHRLGVGRAGIDPDQERPGRAVPRRQSRCPPADPPSPVAQTL